MIIITLSYHIPTNEVIITFLYYIFMESHNGLSQDNNHHNMRCCLLFVDILFLNMILLLCIKSN
jgi:hypothetical protein